MMMKVIRRRELGIGRLDKFQSKGRMRKGYQGWGEPPVSVGGLTMGKGGGVWGFRTGPGSARRKWPFVKKRRGGS